jgi:hypothetical protein
MIKVFPKYILNIYNDTLFNSNSSFWLKMAKTDLLFSLDGQVWVWVCRG